ncbi:uncharacterized protein LOC126375886 isoform X2 [Pectinophora gossypiella]|uniref:uncharacterized protein LOC126375886 isoform X2 n=1 Tax=Pectinophora gossypiella TaxID=13191 RepID=UPI00214EEE0C|nr:uncharacterized protein LOC126375886 isoform X2 [Pectinophora gossypiella]
MGLRCSSKSRTMTVKKATRCGGYAAVVARQKLHSNQQLDILTIKPQHTNYNITVGFNEKDQLQLTHKDDNDKLNNPNKQENIAIDDITNCVNIENYPNCENTLVFYVTKNLNKEAIALKFENEQDFKRIYFTYKYFKMRNRLTNNSNNYTDNVFAKKNYSLKSRKSSIDDFISIYDKKDYLDDGLSLVHQKTRYDQPMSLIGIRNDMGDGEIDSIIYTDIDIPSKPDRKRLFHKKPKAPPPPVVKDTKVLKGEFVRVNVERAPDIIPKDSKINKVPDILMFRDSKPKRTSPTSNLWSASNKVSTGYESDREEWRTSRSQFSTTAFDSLARPAKAAMALTMRKPPRLEPVQYYRLPNDKPKLTPLPFRPNNFLSRPPRLPRPNPDIKRNLNLNLSTDHRKFTSLQSLDIPKKLSEPKKAIEVKKTNHSNLSTKITGLTNKLRDLGNPSNTLGRFKAQSHGDVANLKPVLKDGKRSVVRTCSAEPPKKVTFSAFATVQVV